MTLSRKQVKAFLEVMSSDESRPVMCKASLQQHNDKMYLVTTDSYKLTAQRISDDFADSIGHSISRESLTKWYKLAGPKDRFTDEDVRELMQDNVTDYPKWQTLMPALEWTPSELTQFSVQVSFLVTMENLAGGSLIYKFNSQQLYAEKDGSIYVVMQLKN